MHRKSLVIPLLLLASAAAARTAGGDGPTPDTETADTVIVVDKVQVTAIKQGLVLRSQPVAASIVGGRAIERGRIGAVKNLSQTVPNFHAPDYGSRMTSSIYVRGLGARIDQPVIGLNIDNVPVLNKDNFDTEPGRRRTHRGPARAPVDALRPQHDGRRGERLHALAAHLRGRAADGRIRQRGFLPLPGIVLLQARPTSEWP